MLCIDKYRFIISNDYSGSWQEEKLVSSEAQSPLFLRK